jgi:hypothetical protein
MGAVEWINLAPDLDQCRVKGKGKVVSVLN